MKTKYKSFFDLRQHQIKKFKSLKEKGLIDESINDNGCGCGQDCFVCANDGDVECQWCTHYDSNPENIEDWYICRFKSKKGSIKE